MSYLFDIVREDAAKAVERLFREESVSPQRVLKELRALQDELALYVAALEEEVGEAGSGSRKGPRSSKNAAAAGV